MTFFSSSKSYDSMQRERGEGFECRPETVSSQKDSKNSLKGLWRLSLKSAMAPRKVAGANGDGAKRLQTLREVFNCNILLAIVWLDGKCSILMRFQDIVNAEFRRLNLS
jgi:predicted ABC-class ATPase